jgi:subfamily B ATP-binding cassette protein MsbA
VLAVVGICGIAVWLGGQVIRKEIQLEEFAVLMLALGMLTDPLRKMADIYPRVVRSAAGAARIFAVIDSPEEAELMSGAIELAPLRDRIELREVTYTYPNAATPAIDHLNLTILRGETVALVGPNGSGKTTLAKLLIRFHDPQTGVVLFDGVDIREATLRSLRRQFSLVLQDAVVFPLSIADNIAYGTRRARRELIEAAAGKAHADEFIRARPEGYDEVVGERGSTLSGGQRQRVCIARAVMRDAPILVFDEATSQIDSESERQIQDAIREYATGRTTILIAHRLSTIRFAKRVVVMAAGQVVDAGTHQELLGRCELYATLCRTQLAE